MELKIREMKVSDSRVLIKIIKKLIKECKETWIENIVTVDNNKQNKSESKDGDNTTSNAQAAEVFYSIIDKALETYTDDITEWFASLLNITKEEYYDLPFDTDYKVMVLISKNDVFRFFFQMLSERFKLKKVFENITSNLKEKYDTLTD
jgi:hypothetical protein